MTMLPKEHLQGIAAVINLASQAERIADAIEKQNEILAGQNDMLGEIQGTLHDRLAGIDDTLTGVVNVLDNFDTNLGHHLAALTEAV